MSPRYYCPTCKGELDMLSGCGAVGYFCNHCRKLVSRSKMLGEGDLNSEEEGTLGEASTDSKDPSTD